jgi:hypothetical protein
MSPVIRRRLLYAAGILLGLLLLSYVGIRVALGRLVSAPYAAERLSALLGVEVTVGSVAIGLRPGAVVLLEDVAIGTAIHARRVEAGVRLRPLFDGDVEASRFRLDGLTLPVERGADGGLELAGLASETTTGDASRSLPSLPDVEIHGAAIEILDRATFGEEAEPIWLAIDHLHFWDLREGETARFEIETRVGEGGKRGALELSGRIGPRSADSQLSDLPLSVEIRATALDPTVVVPYLPESWLFGDAEGALDAEVDLSGRLAGDLEGDLSIHFQPGTVDFAGVRFDGESRFDAHMSVKDGSLAFSDGRLRAHEASLGKFPAGDVDAVFAYSDRTLTFESLGFGAFAGTWQQTGSVTFDGPPAFEFETHVDGVHVEKAAQHFSGETVVEFVPTLLAADGTFRGRWTGDADWLAPIEGSGTLELRNGEMHHGTLMGSVAEAMLVVVPQTLRSGGRTKRPKTTRLDHCTLSFTVADGLIRTSDLALVTDDYQLNGAGTLASDLALDLRTHVIFSGQGMDKLILMVGVSSGTGTERTVPPIPVHVTGTLMNPQFAPELPGVRAATMGVLVWGGKTATGVAAGAVDKARGAAGSVLRRGTDRMGAAEAADGPNEETP